MMDPTSDTTDTAVAAATEAAVGAPDTPTADAPPPAAPEAPPWEGKTAEELWNASEKIRAENISYKERFRPWEQTVGDMHEADRNLILGFLAAVKSGDPNEMSKWGPQMRAALDHLSPTEQKAVADAAEQAAAAKPDEFDPFDRENIRKEAKAAFEQEWEQRDQAAQRERAIEQIQAQMSERAGVLADKHKIAALADPTSNLGRLLYITANQQFQTEPDPMARLDLAAQAIVDDLRKQGQELLKAKGADAAPSPAPADAGQPTGARKPRTLEDAKQSAIARIEAAERVGT